MNFIKMRQNFLFLTIFLLGLAHSTSVFAEKTWSEWIKDSFYNGIIIKQDLKGKKWETFKNEKNHTSLYSSLSNLISKKEIITLGKEVFIIPEYRLPFYKKNQAIKVKHSCQSEQFTSTFKNYKTSHHILLSDTIILGAVAITGYFAYKNWIK